MVPFETIRMRRDVSITLFRPIAVLCGTDSILRSIPHIQDECEEYSIEYCQVRHNNVMALNNVMKALKV